MTKGKATGEAREYQQHCRDVLIAREPQLEPYSGDGIDVEFDLGGTTWSIYVALRHKQNGNVVIAECRRRNDAVQQEDLGAFAYKTELLRKSLSVPVAAFFIAKAAIQIGAVKASEFAEIWMALLDADATPPAFTIDFHRYDPKREKRYHEFAMHVPTASLGFHGQLAMVHIKAQPDKKDE